MNIIRYTDAKGNKSTRNIEPIGFDIINDNVLCVDLSMYPNEEQMQLLEVLKEIRKEYITSILDSGFAIRSLSLKGVEK